MKLGSPAPTQYEAQIRRYIERIRRFVRKHLSQVTTQAAARRLGAKVKLEFSDRAIEEEMLRIARRAEKYTGKPWKKLIGNVGARKDSADDIVSEWAKDAAKRIKSVRNEIAKGLAADIAHAARTGIPHEDLARKWVREGIPVEFGTLEGRAKVIAQNQMGELHARMQAERAGAVGVTEFIWTSQGDDLVRKKHRQLNGTKHKYSKPPSEGLPGTPVGCRCWADPVISDELLAEFLPNTRP